MYLYLCNLDGNAVFVLLSNDGEVLKLMPRQLLLCGTNSKNLLAN